MGRLRDPELSGVGAAVDAIVAAHADIPLSCHIPPRSNSNSLLKLAGDRARVTDAIAQLYHSMGARRNCQEWDATMSRRPSARSFVTRCRPHLAGPLGALLLLLSPSPSVTAQNAGASSEGRRTAVIPRTDIAKTELPKITIEATKERALRREVHRFVSAVVVRPDDETLWRWNTPVCPLVAGLPRPFAEFILRRISKAAADARAPLAGKVCHPNLFVVGTNAPDLLLKKWLEREPLMYDTRNGFGPVKRFLDSKRPVRVWYNSELGCGDGGPISAGASALAIGSIVKPQGGDTSLTPGAQACTDGIDTHLNYADTRAIYSALVVIDGRQIRKVDIQQLADYVALAGLADVRLDVDPGAAPTILRLFAGHGIPPSGLTRWDRALLYSLYNTRQQDKGQVGDMESTMVRRIAP